MTVMMLPNTLVAEQRDHIWLLKLNRPEKRNAINDELLLAIESALSQIPAGIKCIIFYGEGKAFSAGLDLSELKERSLEEGLQHSRMWHRVLDKIQFAQVPVIAAIHGACVGGGLEIASACHIRVADESTIYALPEGQRGIFVGGGASVRLPKLIGLARVTDMMLTGRVLTANEGLNYGLTQYLESNGRALEKALELAKAVSANAGLTNYAVTQVLPRIAESGAQEGFLMESLMAAIAQDSPEAKKRLTDFLEGRAKKVGQ